MDDQEAADSDNPVLLQSGTRVRFATPLSIIYGKVLAHKPPSLTLMTDDGKRRIIPLADWYLEQAPTAQEHIAVVDADEGEPPLPERSLDDAHDRWLLVHEAAESARVEPKQLRKYIRKGLLPAFKRDGVWHIPRDEFISFAGDHGWL